MTLALSPTGAGSNPETTSTSQEVGEASKLNMGVQTGSHDERIRLCSIVPGVKNWCITLKMLWHIYLIYCHIGYEIVTALEMRVIFYRVLCTSNLNAITANCQVHFLVKTSARCWSTNALDHRRGFEGYKTAAHFSSLSLPWAIAKKKKTYKRERIRMYKNKNV